MTLNIRTLEEQDAFEIKQRKERIHRHSFEHIPGFSVKDGKVVIGDPANIKESFWVCKACRAYASLAELEAAYGDRHAKVRISLVETE